MANLTGTRMAVVAEVSTIVETDISSMADLASTDITMLGTGTGAGMGQACQTWSGTSWLS